MANGWLRLRRRRHGATRHAALVHRYGQAFLRPPLFRKMVHQHKAGKSGLHKILQLSPVPLKLSNFSTSMPMNITVIVCTFNRSDLLPIALESIAASEMSPHMTWEILVADNSSNDGTRAVVDGFMRCHPGRFRYVVEPCQGKSNALNTAIAAAKGDVLAFADDDVTVHPQWLSRLTAPVVNGPWVGSGGRVIAQWKSAAPDWLDPESWMVPGPIVQFDRDLQAGRLNETPVGTNMAFRKSMFERYGGFRADLGPRPGSEIRNEDSEFARRLLQAGEPLFYEPSAIVYHPVPENRLRKDYFLKWWFDKGRSDIRESGISSAIRWRVSGIPLQIVRRLIRWVVQWMFTLDRKGRFDCKVRVWRLAGETQESRKASARSFLQRQTSAVVIPNDSQGIIN
jgi:glucosyl-dolichyl phosphate glucuronosyltransferase